jgi:hypothetical protein
MDDPITCLGDHRDFNRDKEFEIVSYVQLDVPHHANQFVNTTVLCCMEGDSEAIQWWSEKVGINGLDKWLWEIPTLSENRRAVYSHGNRFFGIYTFRTKPETKPEEWFAYILDEGKPLSPLLRESGSGVFSAMKFPSEQAATNHLKNISGSTNWSSHYRAVPASEAPHLLGGDR